MKRASYFILVFVLFCLPLGGRTLERELRAEVEFLTDPAREGRAFGSPGATSTAFYMFRQFRNAGLRTSMQAFEYGGRAGHNVIGVTPGWYRRYIVVGAYYDGLGELDGHIYPGADSNASGVSALLVMSRMLPELCKGDTGLIFVGFDGHHASLSGSMEFLAEYGLQYDVSLAVNMDIIGSTLASPRPGRPDYLMALGGAGHRLSLEKANSEAGMDLSYDYYGSADFTDLFYKRIGDQRWFLQSGIPSVMFTSGITMNTNKVGDTPEGMDFGVFSDRVALIMKWISLNL